MIFKAIVFIGTIVVIDSYIYSSFWSPLYNPRILNYKVDAKFDPEKGSFTRDNYARRFGYRGKELIVDLGEGRPPTNNEYKDQGDVKFYYTYKKMTGYNTNT